MALQDHPPQAQNCVKVATSALRAVKVLGAVGTFNLAVGVARAVIAVLEQSEQFRAVLEQFKAVLEQFRAVLEQLKQF